MEHSKNLLGSYMYMSPYKQGCMPSLQSAPGTHVGPYEPRVASYRLGPEARSGAETSGQKAPDLEAYLEKPVTKDLRLLMLGCCGLRFHCGYVRGGAFWALSLEFSVRACYSHVGSASEPLAPTAAWLQQYPKICHAQLGIVTGAVPGIWWYLGSVPDPVLRGRGRRGTSARPLKKRWQQFQRLPVEP